ncbi:MAG: type II toxin-antitoxin system VapB family antitoxin [Caldilineaceae bacterium]|nr:type II toxin-antitoxin system VapB family antitoxin [Caldilineaceae bacterium]
MALNIKNPDVERLLNELVQLTGESKTEVVRKALEERRQRLAYQMPIQQNETERILAFLEEEIWPQIPASVLGTRISKEEEEAILGYGENGV